MSATLYDIIYLGTMLNANLILFNPEIRFSGENH